MLLAPLQRFRRSSTLNRLICSPPPGMFPAADVPSALDGRSETNFECTVDDTILISVASLRGPGVGDRIRGTGRLGPTAARRGPRRPAIRGRRRLAESPAIRAGSRRLGRFRQKLSPGSAHGPGTPLPGRVPVQNEAIRPLGRSVCRSSLPPICRPKIFAWSWTTASRPTCSSRRTCTWPWPATARPTIRKPPPPIAKNCWPKRAPRSTGW